MKINPRIFDYAIEEDLIERQEIDENRSVEIYSLNKYPDLYDEFTKQGKFAVWSSADSKNYRLYIEDGYLKKLEPLYKKNINTIWLDFWDACDKSVSKFRNILMPIMLVLILVFFLGGSLLIKSQVAQVVVALSVGLLFILIIFFIRRRVNKKVSEANQESVVKIKNILGEKRFEKLLNDQRSYIDEFFKYDEEQNSEDNVEDNVDSTKALDNDISNDNLETKEALDNNSSNDDKNIKEE